MINRKQAIIDTLWVVRYATRYSNFTFYGSVVMNAVIKLNDNGVTLEIDDALVQHLGYRTDEELHELELMYLEMGFEVSTVDNRTHTDGM